jgi:hypothetical protein
VVTLPSMFFALSEDGGGKGSGLTEEGRECIRFSVANIGEEKVRMLGMRLTEMEGEIEKGVRELLASQRFGGSSGST